MLWTKLRTVLFLTQQILISFALVDPLTLANVHVRLEQYHMYRGEFDCFDHNVSGVHELLRIGLWVCNPNPEVYEVVPADAFLTARIDADQDVLIPLPFLRDTQCLNADNFYTRGSDFKLGGHCCCLIPVHTNCVWLDVTNVSLPDTFDLHISLAGSSNTTIGVADLELELNNRS